MAKYLLLRGWLVFLKTSVHCGLPIFLKVNHQLESRMQEICQSGSEGGAKLTFVPTPMDIEQVILKPEILVGNEGNQMQVAVFAGPSCHLEDLRLDDTVGIVPNPLMIEVECAEYRQEVSIQALHD